MMNNPNPSSTKDEPSVFSFILLLVNVLKALEGQAKGQVIGETF